ncbi:MAG TPA: extracellular solute-binding protein [Spirochaetales bacterium]|nr:extracellular solute-binding protein [Spirochaetales bacterium]HRY53745.1 extracellular solute-binding protein [Spirochaetia bacterium]HRZ63682.1 extracellular solute-binding protein [Spirochaetia bacterium]
MNRTLKRALAAALVAVSGLGLAAQGVVTLRMIAPWADKELEGFKPVLERFEQLNPGIKVEYRTGKPEDTATILSAQFSVKKTPADIIDTSFSAFIVQEARKGNILDISGAVDIKDYRPGSIDQFVIGRKLYGVTSIGGLDIAEYNAKFYRDNKLPEPKDAKTWEDFLALMDKVRKVPGVKAPIGTGGGVGWTNTTVVQTFINTFGGKAMYNGLLVGSISWESPEVKKLFRERLLPLLQGKYFGEPEENAAVTQNMWAGKYGLFFGGTTDSLKFPSPAGDYSVCLLPGQKAISMWTDFWFIPAYTEHPKEALKLMKFLATEGQAIQVKGGGRIATYTKVPLSNYPAAEQKILKIIGSVAVNPDIDDIIGGKFQTVMWDQLKLLWADPTADTLDSVLAEMQAASVETLKGSAK